MSQLQEKTNHGDVVAEILGQITEEDRIESKRIIKDIIISQTRKEARRKVIKEIKEELLSLLERAEKEGTSWYGERSEWKKEGKIEAYEKLLDYVRSLPK
jgi:hypothetical protein